MPEKPVYQKLIGVRPHVHAEVQAFAEAADITMGQLVADAVTMYGEQMYGDQAAEDVTEIDEAVALK
jgi:hypothetical protein